MGCKVRSSAAGRGKLPARALPRARRKSLLGHASARRTALPPHSCCTLTCRGRRRGVGWQRGGPGSGKGCTCEPTHRTLWITREGGNLSTYQMPESSSPRRAESKSSRSTACWPWSSAVQAHTQRHVFTVRHCLDCTFSYHNFLLRL